MESSADETRPVVQYYDQLASRYDAERFGNTYGHYVEAQERRLLRLWLAPFRQGRTLDLACGTGRLLDLVTHGLDASEAMIRVAHQKHPHKEIRVLNTLGDPICFRLTASQQALTAHLCSLADLRPCTVEFVRTPCDHVAWAVETRRRRLGETVFEVLSVSTYRRLDRT